jgi:hypothetical protein
VPDRRPLGVVDQSRRRDADTDVTQDVTQVSFRVFFQVFSRGCSQLLRTNAVIVIAIE